MDTWCFTKDGRGIAIGPWLRGYVFELVLGSDGFGLIASIREKVKGQRTEDLQMGLLDSLDNIPLPRHLARSVVQRK